MKSITFHLALLLFLTTACQNNTKNSNATTPANEQSPPQTTSDIPATLCAPKTVDAEWYTADNVAPLFDGLEGTDFPISTDHQLAQRYFNQGMALAFGFNHAEAARSFHYASRLDSTCAMTHWGFAYVLGPNYNGGMEPDNYQRAFDAIQKAHSLSENASPKEKALIEAMTRRYVKDPPEDRSHLDKAYADALQTVYTRFPKDPHIGAMYAESLMNLHPWDLQDKNGNDKPWTPQIINTLEEVLALDPKHAGAHHFYIHAVEASSTPERGLRSAQLFDEGLVPGSGHLVHMPAHIYIRTGLYHNGTVSNINAVKVDSNYMEKCHAQGAYPLAYYPHNWHFMAATATLEGNSQWAIKAANELHYHTSKEIMIQPGWGTLQHYYTTPYNVLVKFGKWNEILAMPPEDSILLYPTAVRHYARGMAFLGKNELASAKKELASLEKTGTDESLKELTIWDLNSTYDLMQIAIRVLKAEILAEEKNYDSSTRLLKEAVAIEDGLNYNEPPDWFFSIRHHLGTIQLEAQQYTHAIATFEEDLLRLPNNGWALNGLKIAHSQLNDKVKTDKTTLAFNKAWATADVDLYGAVVK